MVLRAAAVALAFLIEASAAAQPRVLDDCRSPDTWKVIAADGVNAAIRPGGDAGRGLCLDFDFYRGAGYCILRRELSMALDEHFRFDLDVRGVGPANNLELKLVDATGENVWWVNRRDFEFPADWTRLVNKRRHFKFAWGPTPEAPLKQISAIEIAVAASSGGKGSLCIDRLTYEPLPPPSPDAPASPRLTFSSAANGGAPGAVTLDSDGRLDWRSDAAEASPMIGVDLGRVREFGGLALEWADDDYPVAYDVSVTRDGAAWERVARIEGGGGGPRFLRTPDADGRELRIEVRQTSRGRGVGLRRLRLMPLEFGDSANAMFAAIAREAPRGRYPSYCLGEQQPWTVVGVPDDDHEALIDAAGAVELGRAGPRVEPFVLEGNKLYTWADATIEQSLVDGYLPIPLVTWTLGELRLTITALADGPPGASRLLLRYTLRNAAQNEHTARLLLALRPFQVLPPWHELNLTGGATRVESMGYDGGAVRIDSRRILAWQPPTAFSAVAFATGEIAEHLSREALPATQAATDPARLASAALVYDMRIPSAAARSVVVAAPLSGAVDSAPPADADAAFDQALAAARRAWSAELNRVTLRLPPGAERIADTFRTAQAHILINADGPRIQPGSRTYERSWIRDGALTSTALLYTGHAERVRAYIDWYAGFQGEDGKVPCVVDRRGPDPVPEHDSTGEFLYLLHTYYRFTRDREFLERHYPRVVKAVAYIESLRSQRMTPEYRDGPPEKRACFGLVPESISHEGYSAKPMHSYWDNFFLLRGVADAAAMAEALGRIDDARRFAALHDDYQRAILASLDLAMRTRGVDFIPGCVELGDFDATSTAIALFPCGLRNVLPQAALQRTFDKYLEFFRGRRDGRLEWSNYTPYEIRNCGAFLRLDQPQHARELLEFFLRDRRPPGWNQWGEVVWRDPLAPGFVGDMPHTWVASEFINVVRNMFVAEGDAGDALVLAAGVWPEWLDQGASNARVPVASDESTSVPSGQGSVAIEEFPTPFGPVSYTLSTEGDRMTLTLRGPSTIPPGGVRFRNPLPRDIRSVTIDGRASDAFTPREVTIHKPAADARGSSTAPTTTVIMELAK